MSQFIPLPEAIAMAKRYRENREQVLAAPYQNQNVLPLSETFDRAAVDVLLAKPGCESVRIYYGMDEALKVHALLVASDAQNADMLSANGDDDVIDQANRCPPICPKGSPLNEP